MMVTDLLKLHAKGHVQSAGRVVMKLMCSSPMVKISMKSIYWLCF